MGTRVKKDRREFRRRMAVALGFAQSGDVERLNRAMPDLQRCCSGRNGKRQWAEANEYLLRVLGNSKEAK